MSLIGHLFHRQYKHNILHYNVIVLTEWRPFGDPGCTLHIPAISSGHIVLTYILSLQCKIAQIMS